MIKCNVTINAVISRNAEMRDLKEGGQIMSFSVALNLPAYKGEPLKQEIYVLMDAEAFDVPHFTIGKRVELSGELTFKKRGERVYLNLSANSFNFDFATQDDAVSGTINFRGGIGKNIVEKPDKKGNPMIMFTGYSAEKYKDTFEYLWVRFLGFNMSREEWLQPKVKADVTGTLELTAYEGRLSIGCRVTEMKEYVKPPYSPDNNR